MFQSKCVLLALAACASTVLASAQATSSPTEVNSASSTSPAAYVYVSSNPTSGSGEINGYEAASNGSLTPIVGSPFPYNDSYMALNGGWLFGISNVNPNNIDSYSIASNGSLMLRDTVTASLTGGALISLFLDHTGSSLYADYYTTNNDYLSYSINEATGSLTFVNDLPGGPPNNTPLSFIGNNKYAYSSSCYHYGPEIFGVQRASNGALTYLNINPPLPTAPSGHDYCPWLAAADPTNHLAVAVQECAGFGGCAGAYQLAVYTVDASGNLTTNSTYQNMPKTLVGTVYDYWMSPDGKYLAVGGSRGAQVFHFNGANPITPLTAQLAGVEIDQLFWDNQDHLYAVSRPTGRLYVWTVSSTKVNQAPGSPHAITAAENLIVLPKS